LQAAIQKDNQKIRMKPGEYVMTDYISLDEVAERHEQKKWLYLHFSGSNNIYDLTGVTILFDTELRTRLNAPRHQPEFMLSGKDNTLKGLTIRNTGQGTSKQGNVFSVHGERNTVRNMTLYVQGSYPYGYGDLLGKGGPGLTKRLDKHCGLRIVGDAACGSWAAIPAWSAVKYSCGLSGTVFMYRKGRKASILKTVMWRA